MFSYYSNGSIKQKFYLTNSGKVEGDFITYYPNGAIQTTEKFKNSKRIGVYKKYFSNGGIQKYLVIDEEGETMYAIHYDEKKNIIKEEGVIFSPMLHSNLPDNKNILVGTKVFLKTSVATRPNSKTNVMVELQNEKGKLEYREKLSINENNIVIFEYEFTKKGEYVINFIGNIREKACLIKNDTLSIKMKCYGSVSE